MARKQDDVFVLGGEPLGAEPRTEEMPAEERPTTRNPFAPAPPDAEAAPSAASAPRPFAWALIAAAFGGSALAAFAAFQLLGGGGQHQAELPAPSRQPAAVVAARLPSRTSLPRPGVPRPAPNPARRGYEDHSKQRPDRPHQRPGGGREREPAREQALPAPPPETTAPAPVYSPEPSANTPATPSPPPASGGGSGRRPEFSFER
jgi:hypothetical protein